MILGITEGIMYNNFKSVLVIGASLLSVSVGTATDILSFASLNHSTPHYASAHMAQPKTVTTVDRTIVLPEQVIYSERSDIVAKWPSHHGHRKPHVETKSADRTSSEPGTLVNCAPWHPLYQSANLYLGTDGIVPSHEGTQSHDGSQVRECEVSR